MLGSSCGVIEFTRCALLLLLYPLLRRSRGSIYLTATMYREDGNGDPNHPNDPIKTRLWPCMHVYRAAPSLSSGGGRMSWGYFLHHRVLPRPQSFCIAGCHKNVYGSYVHMHPESVYKFRAATAAVHVVHEVWATCEIVQQIPSSTSSYGRGMKRLKAAPALKHIPTIASF